jgi:hypothetical protein
VVAPLGVGQHVDHQVAHAAARRLPWLACGIAAGLFFVHGVLDYFLEFTPLYGLFWLTLGLTASGWRSDHQETAGLV